jgi:hypothetical protein
VYARRLGDEVLNFGHRGWLYEDSFLFYDRKTDSLWVQATGQAVHGPLKGRVLDRLPATQTTWTAWRQQHPDTLVLGRPFQRTDKYWHDAYRANYETGKGIAYDRHKPVSFGLAVVLPGAQKLYPFPELAQGPVVLDEVGGVPIVVVYLPGLKTALAFDRRQGDEVLTFAATETGERAVRLKDGAGSTWNGATGRCVNGPRQGAQLRQVVSTQFVVENWPLHYSKGQRYSAPPIEP